MLVTREISVEVPSALDAAGTFNDAINCVAGTYKDDELSASDAGKVFDSALAIAKRCASTAVEHLGKSLKSDLKEALAIVGAFPDTVDALAAVVDGFKVSLPGIGQFGGQFNLTFTRSAPPPVVSTDPPTGPSTEVYALITDVRNGPPETVTYDEIQWFWGADAVKACAQDGVQSQTEWCNDYYFRNANSRLRSASLAPGVTIALAGPDAQLAKASFDQLVDKSSDGLRHFYTLDLVNGVVIEIREVYTP
jgi:hypothetical protein